MDPNRVMTRAQELIAGVHAGRISSARAAAEMQHLVDVVGPGEPASTGIRYLALLVDQLDAQQRNDLVAMENVADRVCALRERLPRGSLLWVNAQVVEAAQRAVVASARGDDGAVRAQVALAVALREELPVGDPRTEQVRAAIDEMVGQFGALVDPTPPAPGPTAGPDENERVLRRAVEDAGDATSRAMALAQLAGLFMRRHAAGGPASLLADAARTFRAAADEVGDGDPRLAVYLTGRAGALLELSEIRHDRVALGEALDVLDRAVTVAGDAAHPQWALLCSMRAHAHRLAGRPDVAARIGREGLRGHAWTVLLQSDPGAAADAARHAAHDAVQEARWSLGYGHNEDALAALESGRGLALQAATRFQDAAEQLRARGAADLARRWERAVAEHGAQEVPVALRREVVALLDAPGPDRWWGAPDLAEIQEALRRLGTDALVYLVAGIPDPGSGNREGGFGLVVPRHGRPTLLMLPDLVTRPGDALDRWARASSGRTAILLGGRDVGPADPDAATTWEAGLEEVCDWAWTAAMGPLLDDHLPRVHRVTADRAPRIAVVAMGELGRVPWHAARHRGPCGWSYAVERAVLSTAVSARMLCAAATVPDVPLTSSALVIGDPDTGTPARGPRPIDLVEARREALAVHRHFYRDGRYLGRRARGVAWPGSTGTSSEVRAWLDDPAGGAVLHAACHGVVRHDRSRANSSCLLLADGDELAAEDLLRDLSTGSPRGLALVVLGACHTGVAGRGYDEALSLATAFLAGGVATVVSAQWAVPDSATSALMYLFHHHLRRDGLAPVDALRAAQLWMLDPDRRPPDAMPPRLREAVGKGRPASIAAWAGFQHSGR